MNQKIAIIDPVGVKAGLDHYDVSLAASLIRKNFQVIVYSNFLSEKFVIKRFNSSFHRSIFDGITLFARFTNALTNARSEKCQVVILHVFNSDLVDLLFIRMTKLWNFKVVVIFHDIESFISGNSESFISNCVANADSVVVHNKYSYEELLARIRECDKHKIAIIPHGNFNTGLPAADRDTALASFNLDSEKRYILFFGMIKKSKGLEILIEAMKKVPEHIHLIIAGRTRDVNFNYYNDLIKKFELESRIHSFARYITNNERHLLFSLSDIAVIPYLKIYQSGVMLYAMSHDVAIVASDLAPNKMIIDNGNGLLFKTGDSDDLALKLKILTSDNKLLNSVRRSAKSYVTFHHDWDKIGEEFIKLLIRC